MIILELNPIFLERMKSLLGETEYEKYLSFVGRPPFKGLRLNTLKADIDLLKAKLGLPMEESLFCKNVYHLPEDTHSLGNHPLHHCGAFYLGDPSATSAVAALDAQPGDIVLDLCASPGGKTVGIACALNGKGFLVSNEVVSSRIQPLISNIERMGIGNAAVTNSRPDDICKAAPRLFTKVLVDAPCSGEGMMLRDGQANANWSKKNVEASADRQRKILDCAAECVAEGGVLVYSTCTFAPEEDELNTAWFLETHPDFYIDDIPANFGISAFAHLCNNPEVAKARRIFPMQGGDGHYVARFRRKGDTSSPDLPIPCGKSKIFDAFWQETFCDDIPKYILHEDKVYITPNNVGFMPGIVRQGIFAGYIKGNRFDPAHSLFTTPIFTPRNLLDLDSDDPTLIDFMRGLEIPCDLSGYTAVRVCSVPFSFGKASGGRLKNHYPKGLRLL